MIRSGPRQESRQTLTLMPDVLGSPVSVVGNEHDEQGPMWRQQRLRSRVSEPERNDEARNLLRLSSNEDTKPVSC